MSKISSFVGRNLWFLLIRYIALINRYPCLSVDPVLLCWDGDGYKAKVKA